MTSPIFTAENTEGFSDADLVVLNEAAAVLLANPDFYPTLDADERVKAAADRVNNNWFAGAAVAELIA